MHTHSVEILSIEARKIIDQIQKLEKMHMAFDCSFDSPENESLHKALSRQFDDLQSAVIALGAEQGYERFRFIVWNT